MSKYLTKYKGTYRLKPNLDINTHDFPRDKDDGIDKSFEDIYIKCAYNCQIYHYGRSTLVAYIPSLIRGHNILKAIAVDLELIDKDSKELQNYGVLYKLLENDKTVFDITENDSEVEFKFNSKHIEFIAKYLKPATFGANISPYSPRNLPKKQYEINEKDLAQYKSILSRFGEENPLKISHITKEYMQKLSLKERFYRTKSINKHMREVMLSGKEYLHYMGYWDEYMKYLEKNLNGH